MGDMGYIVESDRETAFRMYDRALRINRALRAVHGPLEGDEGRSPTGVSTSPTA